MRTLRSLIKLRRSNRIKRVKKLMREDNIRVPKCKYIILLFYKAIKNLSRRKIISLNENITFNNLLKNNITFAFIGNTHLINNEIIRMSNRL
jgi:hypothetical protein